MGLKDTLKYVFESLGYFVIGVFMVVISGFSLLTSGLDGGNSLVVLVSWIGLVVGLLVILYSVFLDMEHLLESI
ncbi:MAG: hypothetical protein MUP63_03465 [Candidatus Nanohaloarchaeota archaeon QJJ-7]|nr:hypothetical protein [Candidatus Nanohaloarchaeota archaeon QJJ-7]